MLFRSAPTTVQSIRSTHSPLISRAVFLSSIARLLSLQPVFLPFLVSDDGHDHRPIPARFPVPQPRRTSVPGGFLTYPPKRERLQCPGMGGLRTGSSIMPLLIVDELQLGRLLRGERAAERLAVE